MAYIEKISFKCHLPLIKDVRTSGLGIELSLKARTQESNCSALYAFINLDTIEKGAFDLIEDGLPS